MSFSFRQGRGLTVLWVQAPAEPFDSTYECNACQVGFLFYLSSCFSLVLKRQVGDHGWLLPPYICIIIMVKVMWRAHGEQAAHGCVYGCSRLALCFSAQVHDKWLLLSPIKGPPSPCFTPCAPIAYMSSQMWLFWIFLFRTKHRPWTLCLAPTWVCLHFQCSILVMGNNWFVCL